MNNPFICGNYNCLKILTLQLIHKEIESI